MDGWLQLNQIWFVVLFWIAESICEHHSTCGRVASLQAHGARPTNDISIEFEIRPQFAVLWFKVNSTVHNEIFTRHDSYIYR